MQCSGIILKITTDLHLVLILLCQVRPFATRRLVKEDNCRPVRRIYSAGTIGWHNSALDRRKFYDIKLHGDFVSHHHILNGKSCENITNYLMRMHFLANPSVAGVKLIY